MKYMTRVALICSVLALSIFLGHHSIQGQQAQNPSYQEMSDRFFNLLQHDKATEGVDYLFGTNPALSRMQDEATNLKTQFGSVHSLMGSYVSHALLTETEVKGMLVYQHYFVAYERQPISVRIKYYKPGTTWMCYGLQFDAKLTDEIEKAADANLSFETK
ncbi:MAG: hypothetical protein ACLQLC_14925 [Candidatus Sulfotelmatobacter sp.]